MKNSVGLGLPEYTFSTDQTVLIVGAGLAGCAIAQALATRGYHCKVIDKQPAPASGTSSLPVAVVRPAINGDQLFTDYFNHAYTLCCRSIDRNLFTQCGSLELTSDQTGNNNPERLTNSGYNLVTADEASTLAGTKLGSSAIYIKQAGFIKPDALCNHWLEHNNIEYCGSTAVCDVHKTLNGWQLLSDTGAVIDESQIVILATAQHTVRFDVASELPLQGAVGQIDRFANTGTSLKCIVNGNGYLLPDGSGVWCGATHHPVSANQEQRDSWSSLQDADTETNRATATRIAPELAISESPSASFAAVRTFTPDRLPVVGALHDTPQYRKNYPDLQHGKPAHHYPPPRFHEGIYVAAGLGSRGATQALAIGELITSMIAGDHLLNDGQAAVQTHFLQALHPARFLIRALKRGRNA